MLLDTSESRESVWGVAGAVVAGTLGAASAAFGKFAGLQPTETPVQCTIKALLYTIMVGCNLGAYQMRSIPRGPLWPQLRHTAICVAVGHEHQTLQHKAYVAENSPAVNNRTHAAGLCI